MNDLIIFSSPIMCVILGWILLLHAGAAAASLLLNGKRGEKITVYSISAVNLCLHAVIFTWSLIKGAGLDELLLVLTASCAVGIVSIGIVEKKIKKENEET